MNQAVLNQAKEVQIDDFVFKKIEGYPLFGFRFDEEKQQYAIANLKSKTYTRPFIDEVEINTKPLLTWVANYVVARIQDKWYLCDCDGNCYQESDTPITICRNLFVIEAESTVINQQLERKKNNNLIIWTDKSKQFAYAAVPCDENPQNKNYISLLNIDGFNSFIVVSDRFEDVEWQGLEKDRPESYCDIVFGVDFKTKVNFYSTFKLIGEKSFTYNLGSFGPLRFSARLNGEFCFYQYGELEVLIGNGKTYFFKTIDDIDEIDFEIPTPQKIGNAIVYRQGRQIIERDLQGNILSENSISAVESYQFALLEKLKNE